MISINPKIIGLFIFLSFHLNYCSGLTCYSCQYPASPDCIENPGKYTTVECGKTDEGDDKDYCYTTRLEDTDEETGDPRITVDRSCCHPFTGSSACPEEYADFEVVTTDTYTKYFTRCQGELCNDGPGDNSDDADNGGDPDRSILVVPGRPDDYKK